MPPSAGAGSARGLHQGCAPLRQYPVFPRPVPPLFPGLTHGPVDGLPCPGCNTVALGVGFGSVTFGFGKGIALRAAGRGNGRAIGGIRPAMGGADSIAEIGTVGRAGAFARTGGANGRAGTGRRTVIATGVAAG